MFIFKLIHQTDQGIKNLPVAKAGELSGNDPDYSNRDLYNAIASGDPVSLVIYNIYVYHKQLITGMWVIL